MASALEQGQLCSLLPSRQPSNTSTNAKADGLQAHKDYASSRSTSFRPSVAPVTPVFSSPSWENITNIWKTSASHLSAQDDSQPIGVCEEYPEKIVTSGLTFQPASTNSRDKLPKQHISAAYNDGPPRNRVPNPDLGDAYRPTLSSYTSQPSTTSRAIKTRFSPPRLRTQGAVSPELGTSMSKLSNATLLSGSAPDIETSQAAQSPPQHDSAANQFKSLNLSCVNDFVPSMQMTYGWPNTVGEDHANGDHFGCSRSDSLESTMVHHNATRSTEINRHRGFMTTSKHHREFSDGLPPPSTAHRDTDPGYLYCQSIPRREPESDRGHGHGQTHKTQFDGWASSGFPGGLQVKVAGQQHDGLVARAIKEQHSLPTHRFRISGSQTCGRADIQQTHELYRISDMNRNAYFENRNIKPTSSHDFQNGLYTPAFTPPTTSESQRSTSGSAPSTRASSQAVDGKIQTHEDIQSADRGLPSHEYLVAMSSNCFATCTNPASQSEAYNPRQLANTMRTDLHGIAEQREDSNKPVSPFLREFKANCKTKHYMLKDVYTYIVEFSGDQHGSRFIQDKLSSANCDEKEQVFAEVRENALQLMTDIFGNYVVQKMFEHGTQAQKRSLANQMKGRVLYLTTQVYGCRVVQKALEHVLVEQQASMVKELQGHILLIVENQNGNHVVQKAIELVPGEHIGFIADALRGQVVRLAKHNYGCRVIQRMLEYSEAPIRRAIFHELFADIPSLITDTFGNYVVQNVIRSKKPKDEDDSEDAEDRQNKARVVDIVKRQLLYYSKHKFASNVVEVAIDFAAPEQQQEILQGLVGVDSNGQSPVYNLIRDQYGNYVIQKVLHKVHGQQLHDLVQEIRHHLITLRRVNNGRQVAAMEKALMDATNGREPNITPHTMYRGGPYSYHFGPNQPVYVPVPIPVSYQQQRAPTAPAYLPMHNVRV